MGKILGARSLGIHLAVPLSILVGRGPHCGGICRQVINKSEATDAVRMVGKGPIDRPSTKYDPRDHSIFDFACKGRMSGKPPPRCKMTLWVHEEMPQAIKKQTNLSAIYEFTVEKKPGNL